MPALPGTSRVQRCHMFFTLLRRKFFVLAILFAMSGTQVLAQGIFDTSFKTTQDFDCPTQKEAPWTFREDSTATYWEKKDDVGAVEELLYCENGSLLKRATYLSGRPWTTQVITRPVPTQALVQFIVHYDEQHTQIEKAELYRLEVKPSPQLQLLRRWLYSIGQDEVNRLEQIDTWDESTNLIMERVIVAPNEEETKFNFEYSSPETTQDIAGRIPELTGFKKWDHKGTLLSNYSEKASLGLEIYQTKTDAVTVAVIDSGFDIWSPALKGKIWKNPTEEINGIDDDQNGLIDDSIGFTDNPRTLGLPVEDIKLPRLGAVQASHGTLIGSLIASENDHVALMSVSEIGSVNSPNFYTHLETFLKIHKVRYTNMSFAIDQDAFRDTYSGSTDRSKELATFITNTPEILHVAAAGNGNIFTGQAKNLDEAPSMDVLPAMLGRPNLLVVGSLATSKLMPEMMSTYQMSKFSNYGLKHVDVLAPGEEACGAALGGGTYCESGTSFAAPYVIAKLILPLTKINPHLTTTEMRELIIKTAYVPSLEKAFPVRSGGIVNVERALAAAYLKVLTPQMTIEEVALMARERNQGTIDGENNSPEFLEKLVGFWRSRKL